MRKTTIGAVMAAAATAMMIRGTGLAAASTHPAGTRHAIAHPASAHPASARPASQHARRGRRSAGTG